MEINKHYPLTCFFVNSETELEILVINLRPKQMTAVCGLLSHRYSFSVLAVF